MNKSETSFYFKQPQTEETQVQSCDRGAYAYRFAYARSAECQQGNDPGQDYLAFREDGARLVFVLCDGVSQSFFGDLAARFLGNQVIEWLWKSQITQAEDIQRKLQLHLTSLVPAASQEVAYTPLPEDIPEMLRSVLNEKRAQGSETMLVGGLFDFTLGKAVLVALGDMRLRVWGPDRQEKTAELGLSMDTAQRWSSLRGVIGSVQVRIVSLEKITCTAAYSDGLARIDGAPVNRLTNQAIQDAIQQTYKSPSSDDVSLFQITTENSQLDPMSLLAPAVNFAGQDASSKARTSTDGEPGTRGESIQADPVRYTEPETRPTRGDLLLPQAVPAPKRPAVLEPKTEDVRKVRSGRSKKWFWIAALLLVTLIGAAALGSMGLMPSLLATATPTATETHTATYSPSQTPTASATPSPTATPTATASPTNTATVSPTITQTTAGTITATAATGTATLETPNPATGTPGASPAASDTPAANPPVSGSTPQPPAP